MEKRKYPRTHTAKLLKPANQNDPGYHKGENCVIERGILSQEGYCSGCWIYMEEIKGNPKS